MKRFHILSFVFFLFISLLLLLLLFYLTSVSFGELRDMISFHVLKVGPVFISIQSINLHAMRFLSYEQTLFFFNFIRMQFDLPTKTDCFLTVKSIKTPFGHKSLGRRQLKFNYVSPVTCEFPKQLCK